MKRNLSFIRIGSLIWVLLPAAVSLGQELNIPKSNGQSTNQVSRKHIIALDIGHTPSHPGAISATGIPEYQFNKNVVEKIRAALSTTKSIEPYVVTSQETLTLSGRSRLAAEHNAELFIAIHHDSAQDKYLHTWEVDGSVQHYADEFSGYGVFFSRRNVEADTSLQFAKLLGESMAAEGFHFARHHAEAIKGENREIVDAEAGVYRFDDLIVLRTAKMPAVLLECGVIVNRLEEKSLLTPERQEKIANAVKTAVLEYFREPRPQMLARTANSGSHAGGIGSGPVKEGKAAQSPSIAPSPAKSHLAAAPAATPPPKRSLLDKVLGRGKPASPAPSAADKEAETGSEEP